MGSSPTHRTKKNKKIFQKTLDKCLPVWYNKDNERGNKSPRKEEVFMLEMYNAYEEYTNECKANGTTPKTMDCWLYELMN